MVDKVDVKWYVNGLEIENVDEYIENLSDEQLDEHLVAFTKKYKGEIDKNIKMSIATVGSGLLVLGGNALIIASNFSEGSAKNIMLGIGLATMIPAFIGQLKLYSKGKKQERENVVPFKTFLEKLKNQKAKRELGKEVFPELF